MKPHPLALPVLSALLCSWIGGAWIGGVALAADERAFELRIYTAEEGKLDALHRRFREHTIALFQKHGMHVVGFWTPSEGDEASNTLVYLLAFPGKEARDRAWRSFVADPEWQRVYAESRRNGPLVQTIESTMLKPTDYSPLE